MDQRSVLGFKNNFYTEPNNAIWYVFGWQKVGEILKKPYMDMVELVILSTNRNLRPNPKCGALRHQHHTDVPQWFIHSLSATTLSWSGSWWVRSLSQDHKAWGGNTPRATYVMFLGGGKKPENQAETYTDTLRTCETWHRQLPQLRTELYYHLNHFYDPIRPSNFRLTLVFSTNTTLRKNG